MQKFRSRLLLSLVLFFLGSPLWCLTATWQANITSSDGEFTKYITQTIHLTSNVSCLSVSGLPDGEYEDTATELEYRWYINNHELSGVNSPDLSLAEGLHLISGPGHYSVACQIRVKKICNNEALYSDWGDGGTCTITFFNMHFKGPHGEVITTMKLAAGYWEHLVSVLNPADTIANIRIVKNSPYFDMNALPPPGDIHVNALEAGKTGRVFAYLGNEVIASFELQSFRAVVRIYHVP